MNKRIFLSPPWMGGDERGLVDEAFASNYIAPCGPMVERFEREFAGVVGLPQACAVSSGTAALDLLFHELGVTRGDRIFCSDLTFVSSIAPAVHRGAEPVFIDGDEATWTMDPDLLEEALADAARTGRRPKAVVAVDLYGQCCDYGRIEPLCAKYGVPLIVDAAEALGARYHGERGTEGGGQRAEDGGQRAEDGGRSSKVERPETGGRRSAGSCVPTKELMNSRTHQLRSAGQAGWAAVYSFNGNKIITTSGGGMIASSDEGVVARARKRSQQAREPVAWYEHEELGYNYRMSNIVAAIGVGQLRHLDEIVAKKRQIFAWYRQKLGGVAGIGFMPEAAYGRCTRWLTVMEISSKVLTCGSSNVGESEAARAEDGRRRTEDGRRRTEDGGRRTEDGRRKTEDGRRTTGDGGRKTEDGMPADAVMRVIAALEREHIESRPVWKPMHLQPVFRGAQVYGGEVSERLFANGLCLPSGTGLEETDVARVCAAVTRELSHD